MRPPRHPRPPPARALRSHALTPPHPIATPAWLYPSLFSLPPPPPPSDPTTPVSPHLLNSPPPSTRPHSRPTPLPPLSTLTLSRESHHTAPLLMHNNNLTTLPSIRRMSHPTPTTTPIILPNPPLLHVHLLLLLLSNRRSIRAPAGVPECILPITSASPVKQAPAALSAPAEPPPDCKSSAWPRSTPALLLAIVRMQTPL